VSRQTVLAPYASPVVAAVYARKSTEQHGADADAKSVARQMENARAFALAKGWTVADDHVYSDDAISGAETRKLVNRQRLLDTIAAGRPPFQILIVRDASRLSRRDGDEAFGELKRIAQAGVEIWFYVDGTRFTYGTFGDNVVGFVRAEMNAEYRRQVAKWTHEAMVRKAQAGHVTGGACFGYTNVRVDGHTERRINEAEAAIVRRIFALCADGTGYTRIAKQLNEERAPAPTPQRGQPVGWSPSNVRAVLYRPLYRGEVVYNQTRRRAADGSTTYAARPESEWLRVDRPELRIVSTDAWTAAHSRLEGIRTHLALASGGRMGRRRRDIDSAYLLSGFARCAQCGGSIGVLDRRQYGCIAYHKRGTTVCTNAVKLPIAKLDAAVLATLRDVLHPKAVLAIIDGLLQRFAPPSLARDLQRGRREVETLDREITNLATAIAQGGQLLPLLEELKTRQARRDHVAATLASHAAVDRRLLDRVTIDRKVRQRLAEWQTYLAGKVDQMRQTLREILAGPLLLTPDGRAYRFEGEAVVGALLLGSVGLPTFMARPAGLEPATPGLGNRCSIH
jgi:site-specific DNA recombinase